MSWVMTQDTTIRRCEDCGEIGRVKAALKVRGRIKLLCHDEDKSCYNYVLMRAKVAA
jgi:hypothetical protein